MEERLNSPGLRMRTDELLAFDRDLKEEIEALRQLLGKIDDKLHALQVERLYLLSLLNKLPRRAKKSERKEADKMKKTLDLSVASAAQHFNEEVEEDEDSC